MNSQVKIIPAEEKHIEAACDIAIAAWTAIREVARRELGDDIYNALFTNWQEGKRASVRAELTSGRGYVAVYEDKVVGFISYFINEANKCGTIGTNAVDPAARGLGIGTGMYEFVLSKMREEGMKLAAVHTGLDDGHAAARAAYQKVGFKKALPNVNYYMEL